MKITLYLKSIENEIKGHFKRRVGIEDSNVYLFDDEDFLYACRCAFTHQQYNLYDYMSRRCRDNDPYLDTKVEVLSQLIERIRELTIEMGLIPSQCSFRYIKGTGFVVIGDEPVYRGSNAYREPFYVKA